MLIFDASGLQIRPSGSGAFDGKSLVVVVVERVESVGVIYYHIEQSLPVWDCGDVLVLEGAAYHLHQLMKLAQLVATKAVVHGIAF